MTLSSFLHRSQPVATFDYLGTISVDTSAPGGHEPMRHTMRCLQIAIVFLAAGLVVSLDGLSPGRAMAADGPDHYIVLFGERAIEVEPRALGSQDADLDRLWIKRDELPRATGLELKPEGLCVGELCMAIDEATRRSIVVEHENATWIDLLGLAATLNQPVAAAPALGVWSFGQISQVRTADWEAAEAPDFVLPDREGNEVRLSDFRGKKVLLLSWASWCGCSLDLPGWQTVYEELKDQNFELVAAAQDTAGEAAAGKYYDKAQATYTTLIDKQHTVSTLYQMVNVPMGVWIDETGHIVRPAEVAYSDKVSLFGISVDGERYVDGLRDWVANGKESIYALSPAELAARRPKTDANAGLADAHFKLAVYLHEQGQAKPAQTHWEEAQRLHPDDWNYHRQDWSFRGEGLSRWLKKFRALDGKPYYAPLDLPEPL